MLLLRYALKRQLTRTHFVAVASLVCGCILTQLNEIAQKRRGAAAAPAEGEQELHKPVYKEPLRTVLQDLYSMHRQLVVSLRGVMRSLL